MANLGTASFQTLSTDSPPLAPEPLIAPQLFIYMLFQASVRPMLSKALGWGPSNAMLSIKPTIPRALQFGFLKEK